MPAFLYRPASDEPIVSELNWPRNDQLDVVSETVSRLVGTWQENWFAKENRSLKIVAVVASEFDFSKNDVQVWHRFRGESNNVFWLGFPANIAAPVRALMLGVASGKQKTGVSGEILLEIASHAAEDLIATFDEKLGSASGIFDQFGPEKDVLRPWSGAVILQVDLNVFQFVVVLNSVQFDQCLNLADSQISSNKNAPNPLQKRGGLHSIESAIVKKPVEIRVELSGCELDLGTLQNLCLGDVIQLPHLLDEPLRLTAKDGNLLCLAYLGRSGSEKAVELISSVN